MNHHRGATAAKPPRYVPILKTLGGELRALEEAAASTRNGFVPLVEVARQKIAGLGPPPSSRLPRTADRLEAAIGPGRPFFLDFPWLSSKTRIKVRQGNSRVPVLAIEHIMADCIGRGLDFIPVARPTKDVGYLSLVKNAAAVHGRGVCLRIPLAAVWVTGNGIARTLDSLLTATDVDRGAADLLLDLRYIDPTPGFDAGHLARSLASVPALHEWRSLTIAGTVIPSTLAGFQEDDITPLQRHEWRVWKELRSLGIDRLPDYGDYGVQHPDPPDASGPGMRANIRYTTDDCFLMVRGRSVIEYGYDQYSGLCTKLSGHKDFAGGPFSWGDQAIVDCAAGYPAPKTQQHWRGAGTSHHLRHVVEALGRG